MVRLAPHDACSICLVILTQNTVCGSSWLARQHGILISIMSTNAFICSLIDC